MKHRVIQFIIILLLTTGDMTAGTAGQFYVFGLQYDAVQLPSREYILSNFRITWSSANGQLRINHQLEPAKTIWQNVAGKGFCGAAKGNATFVEKAGSFAVTDQKSDVTQTQTIDQLFQNGDTLYIRGRFLSGVECSYSLGLFPASDKQLHMHLQTGDAAFNRTYLSYACQANEHFFGFGEQPSHMDHKGYRIPVLVQEQGIGRGDKYSGNFLLNALVGLTLGASVGDDYTSYKVVPQYLSSLSNSLYLENYEYSEFDLTKNDQVQVELYAGEMRANIIYAADPYQAIEEYTFYCGRMKPLPDWIVRGAVIGMQGGTGKVYDVWNILRESGTPLSAFWVQDWIGQRTTLVGKQLWWNWELDNDRYPGWNHLQDTLSRNGISLMGYINPFLVDVTRDKPNYRRDLYGEAVANGFLVLDQSGQPYQVQNSSFTSGILDLSDQRCIDWVKDIIKDEMLARGLKGWMADFGEALPFDVELHSGESAATFHNKYPEIWEKINQEAIAEAGLPDTVVFFSRSGYTQSPKYATLFWQGDQLVNWGPNDGLKSAVTGLLSGGLSGFTLNHSDIGGYTSITIPVINSVVLRRSKELLWRWMEYSAFTPVYRTHEGLGPDKNYQVYDDTATAYHFARNAKIYKAWLFYRKQLMQEAAQYGYPICRPMFLEFPADANTFSLSGQFMVGSELIVAPVLDPNKTSVNVYLPAGSWVNVWTNAVTNSTGQFVTVGDLPDRPAVFYRQGSVVGQQFKQNLVSENIH